MPFIRMVFRILLTAYKRFTDHHVVTLSAGLAFYTALSLAPLLVILAYATRFIGGSVLQSLVQEITKRAGPELGAAMRFVLSHAQTQHATGIVSGIMGLIGVLFWATAVFSHLHWSLNTIWGLREAPRNIVGEWLRSNALSFVTMAAMGALTLLSIVINTVLNLLPHGGGWLSKAAHYGQTLILYVLLFGFVYKVLPDTKVLWRDALFGALFTSGLFVLGNLAILEYIRFAGISSIYGAAGSLFVFLVYVYYVSLTVCFGAEVTCAFAQRHVQAATSE